MSSFKKIREAFENMTKLDEVKNTGKENPADKNLRTPAKPTGSDTCKNWEKEKD